VQIDMQSAVRGAIISEVTANGPADVAGLKSGNVVVKVDDRFVLNGTEFIVAIRSHNPGDKVVLTLESGKTLTVTLGSNATNS
jgi:putative serine protease PepD